MTFTTASPKHSVDGRVVHTWWERMQPRPEHNRRGDRAALAELRRCRSPIDVCFLPAFAQLRKLHTAAYRSVDDLAVAAAVVASVREHTDEPVARALAKPSEGSRRPPMSPERFRRLLQVKDPVERIDAGVRLVRMLRGRVNVADLAESLATWNENTKRRWALEYYDNVPEEAMKTKEE